MKSYEQKRKIIASIRRISKILLAKEDMERAPREDRSNPFSQKKLRKKCPESIKDLTEDVSKDPDLQNV